MTYWTEQGLILANNHDYLDRLYSVYPVNSNIRRNLSQEEKLLGPLKQIGKWGSFLKTG